MHLHHHMGAGGGRAAHEDQSVRTEGHRAHPGLWDAGAPRYAWHMDKTN